MFDLFCIATAFFLCAQAVKEYRVVAFFVALEFALHKVIYLYAFTDLRAVNPWLVYLFYAFAQIIIIAALYKSKSHFVIIGLIFINAAYNLSTVVGFFYYELSKLYYIYPYFVGFIMILELMYLGLLNKYAANYYSKHGSNDINYLNSIFCVRAWPDSRRIFRTDL